MKPYVYAKLNTVAILSILSLILVSGCSITRRLKPNQSLVRKITVKGIGEEFAEPAKNYVDKQQQPNSIVNLQFYYAFSKNGKKNIGEPPAILDSDLVEFSRLQIQKFLQNKGFLNARVADDIKIKNKKAELIFTVTPGTMFKVRRYKDSIADPKLAVLYHANKNMITRIRPNKRYDEDSLAFDREQFYQLMKRNGYYDFYRQYVNFSVDTALNRGLVDVDLVVDNPAGKKAHTPFTINNTLIVVDRSSGRARGKADTLQLDSQFRFVDFSGKFNSKTITRYIFQKKGQLYNINNQTLTTTRLSELNVFRNVPSPAYTKTADSTNRLNSRIELIPLKKMSNRVEAEFIFNNGRYGFNLANTYTNRNLFGGAEILQVKFNYSILYDNAKEQATLNNGIQNQDFKIGANLTYPGIISPFGIRASGLYGIPHTTFASSYDYFFQNGLVARRNIINSITYDWAENNRRQYSFTPINIQFSSGKIDPQAAQDLLAQNRYSYIYLIGRTVFTAGSQYTFSKNYSLLTSYQNFIFFRGNLDLGGNSLALISKLTNAKRDTLGQRTVFGQAFSQYVKGEADLRFYRSLGGERQFIFRINPGIGVPYGNSNQLIFEKNFYVGGTNDMRAWLPRTLGPGGFNRATFYANNDQRARFKYLDQFGEIKIVANAEYRYKIANNFFGSKLKGAVFTDIGNVWRLKDQPLENPGGQFTLATLPKTTAIGIGTGLRVDLGFFVFRLDAGLKFKDPQFGGSEQWVLLNHLSELFYSGDFKNNYLQNNGEKYSFMQLNFGIGMPF
ncbi:BamA/TamA family outer membrane protein [uncultured Mucilaginibacter sp.]|uniref:translocation and assembly module lipoprotein TamL n=1 Tax=uncultured Mucilaginibacter sp. TaxID=797541 RepID=UPI00261EA319|nr:BamA/TamA family outer membrane protein [uncultured Mucilaginibacter sp.]